MFCLCDWWNFTSKKFHVIKCYVCEWHHLELFWKGEITFLNCIFPYLRELNSLTQSYTELLKFTWLNMIKWSSILSSAIFLSKERKKIYLPIDQNHQHFVLIFINFYHQQCFLCCLTNNNIQNQITKKPQKNTQINAYRFFTPFWMGFNNQINKNLFHSKDIEPKMFHSSMKL